MNPQESDIPGVIGRRSARLSIIVPITIRGTDTSGQTFKENTWTINVNKHGGRLATFHQLAADDLIVIENPLLGTDRQRPDHSGFVKSTFPRTLTKSALNCSRRRTSGELSSRPRTGRKSGRSFRGSRRASTSQAAPPIEKTPAAIDDRGRDSETPHLAPPASPAEVGEQHGGLSQFNMVLTALSRFAGEATPPPSQPSSLGQNGTGVPKAPAAHSQTPDSLPLTPLQEKINEAQSLRQELTALVDRAQSARAEVEGLLLKAQEAWRDWTSQTEEVAKEIEEASAGRLQSALASLDQDVEQRLASASTRLAGETSQRWQAEAAGIVENVAKEVGDRLSPLAQESLSKATLGFQAQRDQAAAQARAELDELVKDATAVVDARIRKVMEEVSPSLNAQFERSAEQAAREQLEEFKAQIETARRSSEDSTRQDLETMQQETEGRNSERRNPGGNDLQGRIRDGGQGNFRMRGFCRGFVESRRR